MLKKIFSKTYFYGGLGLFIIFSAAPFYNMLITMFKRSHDLVSPTNNPFWLNESPTLEHLDLLFNQTLFPRFLLNTFLVGLAVVVITVLLAVPAAISLARLARRWGESVGIGIFLTYLIPPTLLFIPLSRVVSFLGLQNSLWSLVLASTHHRRMLNPHSLVLTCNKRHFQSNKGTPDERRKTTEGFRDTYPIGMKEKDGRT